MNLKEFEVNFGKIGEISASEFLNFLTSCTQVFYKPVSYKKKKVYLANHCVLWSLKIIIIIQLNKDFKTPATPFLVLILVISFSNPRFGVIWHGTHPSIWRSSVFVFPFYFIFGNIYKKQVKKRLKLL